MLAGPRPVRPAPGRFSFAAAPAETVTSLEQRERRDMADKPVRADKATAVAELTESFRARRATVLTEYRGLTVAQLTQLRRSLGSETTLRGREEHAGQACRDRRGHHRPRRAVHRSYRARFRLAATSSRRRRACATSRRPTRCSSSRAASSRARPSPRPRSRKLADLESREVLLAKLAGAMKGNLSKAAALFQAPLSQGRPPGGRAAGQAREGGRRGGLRPPAAHHVLTSTDSRKGRQTWRSSAPTSCSTRSRR